MNETELERMSVPEAVASRGVEAMLWRAALSLASDEGRADAALEVVWRFTSNPARTSEGRLLRLVIDGVQGGWSAPVDSASWRAEESVAWRLVRLAGTPVDVVANAMGLSEREVDAEVARGDAAMDPVRARGMATQVASADVRAALGRVDGMTAGLRRRRLVVNVLKYGTFVFVLGLVVFVMFDLRKAADQKRAKLTPGDVYSLPMPKTVK